MAYPNCRTTPAVSNIIFQMTVEKSLRCAVVRWIVTTLIRRCGFPSVFAHKLDTTRVNTNEMTAILTATFVTFTHHATSTAFRCRQRGRLFLARGWLLKYVVVIVWVSAVAVSIVMLQQVVKIVKLSQFYVSFIQDRMNLSEIFYEVWFSFNDANKNLPPCDFACCKDYIIAIHKILEFFAIASRSSPSGLLKWLYACTSCTYLYIWQLWHWIFVS